MVRVLMVCHGNICRSPMAEFVLRDMVRKQGLDHWIEVASCATSREEIGNPVHHKTRELLAGKGISCQGKVAVLLKAEDYDDYDYILAMDSANLKNMRTILGEDRQQKIFRLLDFTDHAKDIADPWYTGDFVSTYQDVSRGCDGFLGYVKRRHQKEMD